MRVSNRPDYSSPRSPLPRAAGALRVVNRVHILTRRGRVGGGKQGARSVSQRARRAQQASKNGRGMLRAPSHDPARAWRNAPSKTMGYSHSSRSYGISPWFPPRSEWRWRLLAVIEWNLSSCRPCGCSRAPPLDCVPRPTTSSAGHVICALALLRPHCDGSACRARIYGRSARAGAQRGQRRSAQRAGRANASIAPAAQARARACTHPHHHVVETHRMAAGCRW